MTGSLAAAAPFLLFTVPVGLVLLFSFHDPMGGWNGLPIMVAPLIVTLPIVLVVSTVLGLPLTYLFSHSGAERGQHYVAAGTFLGGVLPFAVSVVALADVSVSMFYFAAPGALGGGVTGWSWGRHRDALIAARHAEDADFEPTL
jgi:hypothetical protein